MKSNIVKAAIALGAAAFSIGSVQATGVFTVDPTNLDPAYKGNSATGVAPFQSDYIAGNYNEVVTLSGGATGTFSYSILWSATGFQLNNLPLNINTGLGTPGNVFPSQYVLWATLQGSGTYDLTGSTLSFTPNTGGMFNLYAASDLTSSAPANGSTPFTVAPIGTQYDLITGTVVSANGTVFGGCPDSNCGSFGVTTDISLVDPNGKKFFTSPDPFFNVAFTAGNFKDQATVQQLLNAAATGGNANISGGAQVTFNNVPEPSALALVGLGLFAAGLARRKIAV